MFLNFLRNIQIFEGNPTLKLLTISIFISVSGIFRAYVASIILNMNINLLLGLAVGFIIYSIYTFDRVDDSKFTGSNKKFVLAIIALLSLVGFYIFAVNGVILIALSSCVIGYLYGKEIKIGKRVLRLKGSYGIKNIVVGIVWAGLTVCPSYSTKLIPLCLVFLFMFSKSFINSTINDFKDIQEDKLNGILTLPVSLGELQTRNLLIGILFFSNLVLYAAMLQGVIQINYIILLCSLVCGLLGIMTYKDTQSKFSKTIRDGEALITVLLVLISGSALTAFSL
jgi:4-hydroxybenzoate polyprenyltransferase